MVIIIKVTTWCDDNEDCMVNQNIMKSINSSKKGDIISTSILKKFSINFLKIESFDNP